MDKKHRTKREKTQAQLMRTVLQFITSYVDDYGYSPSIREIADECHLARATVSSYLDRLEIEGFLRRDLGIARGITLLNRDFPN